MKFGLVALLIFIGMYDLAQADIFNVSVPSGVMKRVHMYMSWKSKDCTPNKGIVKVLVKPQHGKLTPYEIDTVITRNRFKANDPCIGKSMKGFDVSYQSNSGFRGTDSFKIEATYGNRKPVIDTYKITVN